MAGSFSVFNKLKNKKAPGSLPSAFLFLSILSCSEIKIVVLISRSSTRHFFDTREFADCIYRWMDHVFNILNLVIVLLKFHNLVHIFLTCHKIFLNEFYILNGKIDEKQYILRFLLST